MTITRPIPDELGARLGDAGDVSRRALEAFGLAEYQAGRLTRLELRQLLGIATRYELDGFFKALLSPPAPVCVAPTLIAEVGAETTSPPHIQAAR